MLLSRKKLYRIKKTKKQSRRRRKQRNKKKYKRRKKAGSRRKRRALNLRKKTMKSYHKGGYNRRNLSFLAPYWNETSGKQELYIVTQKSIANRDGGDLGYFDNEKRILAKLFLKGENDNTDNTKRILKELFKSINKPQVFNIYFKKAIKVEGEGLEEVINKLLESVESITNLNRKLFESQISENPDGTTGFLSRDLLVDRIVMLLTVMKRQLEEVPALQEGDREEKEADTVNVVETGETSEEGGDGWTGEESMKIQEYIDRQREREDLDEEDAEDNDENGEEDVEYGELAECAENKDCDDNQTCDNGNCVDVPSMTTGEIITRLQQLQNLSEHPIIRKAWSQDKQVYLYPVLLDLKTGLLNSLAEPVFK